MKIILLGGAGEMGSRAAEDLAAAEEVSRVTIADRNEAVAARIAGALQGRGAAVDARFVDAFDHAGLVEALRGYDVVAGALGPFYIFEARLIQAALEAGVDYCSICDEWEPAETVLDQFDDEARRKGLTVITGLGASPGITNMAVRHGAQDLDIVRRVQVAVYLPLDCGVRGAALRHALYIMTGGTAVWRCGRRSMIKACTEKRSIEFPRFGTIDAWNMGHSEPATIPRYFPDVQDAEFFMGFGPGTSAIARLARWGAFAGERRARLFVRAVEAAEKIFAGPEPGPGATRIDLWGEKDGRKIRVLRCGVGLMRETTGLSLSVGAYMLGRRELLNSGGGVFAPEGCLEAGAFFRYLHDRGVDTFQDVEMDRPVF